MNRTQKIVVTLLIISVILSLISVIINISVLNFGSDSLAYQSERSGSGSTGAGEIAFFVEESPGSSNG